MSVSLVVLAAGLGSRFKGGVKQASSVGPNGEWIMDYSIYHAIEVGFNRIIFVIRKDMEDFFIPEVLKKYQDKIKVEFVFQKMDDLPISVSIHREKPWGTGHAIYALRHILNEPFMVMNADDYYGKETFLKMYSFLTEQCDFNHFSIVGYPLRQTLSDRGSVNRGICDIKKNRLVGIQEVLGIQKDLSNQNHILLHDDMICSMGVYGFNPSIFPLLEEEFISFLKNDLSCEFMIPEVIQSLLKQGIQVDVLPSTDEWIGMTYFEDLKAVKEYFLKEIDKGNFPKSLF